ncbi:MAG TPA: efflux transporter outer membrane subunit [Smithellaceae bacterium]|nr:efflux transporter outer membrane subunit [Smithellaceae bacterium]
MIRKLFLFSIIFLFAACAVGPDYQRPDVQTPGQWRFADDEKQILINECWWKQFNDPVLNKLMETALKENKDVLIAAARIEEYRGRFVATRGDLFPKIQGGLSAEKQRATEQGYAGWPAGVDNPYSTYAANISASWEIDFWGKVRRSTESARADLLSKEEAHRAVLLSLMASVVNAYIDLRDYDRQLVIAKETLETRKDSLEIYKLRFEAGVISDMELSQMQSEYENTRATIPKLEKSIAQQENALNLLLGRNPGPVERGLTIDQLQLPAVPAGLPSELLSRRPDIRQAEQDMISANAKIGVAKAAYFPSLSLTGTYGSASADLSNLFSGPAQFWNLGANITVPIFTAGRTWGQVKASEAVQKQALLNYVKSIQTAFREVEDSLVDQNRTRVQLDALFKQLTALRNYRDLARLRYDNGYSSNLEVLDAERNLFNIELNYVQTRGGLFKALINLYKAMGGGWTPDAQLPAESLKK